MAGESGIEAAKAKSVLRREMRVEPRKLVSALGKAAVSGAFLQWDGLAKNAIDVLDSLGLGTSEEEIAGLLIARSLFRAMRELVWDNRELFDEERPNDLRVLYREVEACLERGEVTVDRDFFERPGNLAIVPQVRDGFARWLRNYSDREAEIRNISNRLPAYFTYALNAEWRDRESDYLPLKQALDTPFTQATEKECSWQRYRAKLQKSVEEPMFLESFGLKRVYVPLRAYYEEFAEGSDREFSGQEFARDSQRERVVVDLCEELKLWARSAERDDAIRLITGGPGSGKSSFAKMFAAELAEAGEIPVLLIPLHLFKVSGDLEASVKAFVDFEGSLSYNPLERDNQELRLLIIFDGLDELSMQGKVAAETAREFVEEVRRLVDLFNQQKTRLQVLISGREVVVQANRSKFRKPRQLLYLLPYLIGERRRFRGNSELLSQDQRQVWWRQFGEAKGTPCEGMPSELDTENLEEITAQPLLNYLVALSIERDNLQFTEDTNLNEVYADLLDAVYERGYEKKPYRPTEEIKKGEFSAILEEIALACWHGDGRTTTVKEIESHCDHSGVTKILERFQKSFKEDSAASITRLLTAFYFRESGDLRESEKTFEFTHKSFGEYLTAKRIIREVRRIHKNLAKREQDPYEGYDERDALIKWVTLCGAAPMTEYLLGFVLDEVRILDREEVSAWQQTFCRLIEYVMRNGTPVEGLKERPKFHEEMRLARNAEEALLVVLSAFAGVTEQISQINWGEPEAFGTWLSRLQGQRTGDRNVLALACCNFLDLSNCNLFVGNLYGAYLIRANLYRANLEGANLEGANLEGANLVDAYLEGANLERANLERANLERANLYRANLYRANLYRANLVDAYLERAYLVGADLEGANLEGANLEGANLEGAILERANLVGANLVGAILYRAKLRGTILENTQNQENDRSSSSPETSDE